MDKRWRGFLSGFMFAVAGFMLILDAIGKEDYLAALPNLWIEWYISVPLAIILLIISMCVFAPEDGTKKDG